MLETQPQETVRKTEEQIWSDFEAQQNTGDLRMHFAKTMAQRIAATIGVGTDGVRKFTAWNNSQNKPPLSDIEWRAIWEQTVNDIQGTEPVTPMQGGTGGISDKTVKSLKAAQIIELAQITGVVLFHDQFNDAYAAVSVDEHQETMRCKGDAFKEYLQKLCWDVYSIAPSSEAMKTAITTLAAKARYSGSQIPLNLRCAFVDGVLWYDLGDSAWRAVKIIPGGWEIVERPPILFRRFAHQQAQVLPERGSVTTQELLKFVNVSDKDKQLLLLVYMVAAFIPDFAHPILSVFGPYGSAKSNLGRLLRRIIDPSIMETTSFPKNVGELPQILSHNYALFFDNLSGLTEDESNALSKAVTGDAISKRVLYSDDEDHIYSYKRIVSLNGINRVGSMPDLLERSLLMELERIEPSARKTEEQINKQFEAIRAQLLAAIFDALALALAAYPTVEVKDPPRMADFTRWGMAIAQALDYSPADFFAAYRKNMSSQNEQVLEDSEVAQAMRILMTKWKERVWFGSPTDLYIAAKKDAGVILDSPDWPKSPAAFMKKFNEVKTNLAEIGIKISQARGGGRIVTIEKTADFAAAAALAPSGTQGNP